MKILIADDDSVARLLLQRVLEKLGHQVLAAEDGEAAWAMYREEDVRLLILDWMMPKLDGLELCRMIRAENDARYTYIIVLTVLEGRGCYLDGMSAGADDFVNKPVGPDELAARLRVGERILGLQTEVRQLKELLPICSYCKKIRDVDNTWHELDLYIAKKTDTSFSHGVCGECLETHVEPQLQRLQDASSSQIG